MRRKLFILGDGSPAVEGWTTGELWNGFEWPYFDEEQLPAALAVIDGTWTRTNHGSIVVRFAGCEDEPIEYFAIDGFLNLHGLCWTAAE